MSPDSWTVFAAVVLPYVPYLLVAAEKQRRGIYDPANPRDSNSQLEGWSLRAKGAELNSWEALTAYLAVTWIAHTAGADEQTLTRLGVAWVVSRLVYYLAYVSGMGKIRILAWFTGVGLILARFAVAVGT
jgi:uncharacterized MAPEG superfamily protein